MRVCRLPGLHRMMAKSFMIGLFCILIASCGVMDWGETLEQAANEQAAEEAFGEGLDLSEDDDDSEPISDGSDLITGPSEACPTTPTDYYLWYDHTCVMDTSVEDIKMHFEETSDWVQYILRIKADGEVVHEFEPRGVFEDDDPDGYLDFTGSIESDSGTCPITNYSGSYPIRAEITGQCENGMVNLHVKMERIDFNIEGDCQLAGDFNMPGVTSAPEFEHSFVHRHNGDAYIYEIPPGGALAKVPGMFNCTYLFVLQPASLLAPDELELIPLVPPGSEG